MVITIEIKNIKNTVNFGSIEKRGLVMTSHNIQGTRHCSLFNQKFNIIMCQVLYVRSNMWVKNIAELIVLDIPIYNLP